ncbi:MAG TPA: hypothetical protein VIL86_06460 [Tepidisphaeraceae bacterium]|jgi:hypothetical protein
MNDRIFAAIGCLTPVRAYSAEVDSRTLQKQQVAAMADTVGRELRYLGKLRQRMEQVGFPPEDRLYRSTSAAFNAMQGLFVELHYLSCSPETVGRQAMP